MSRFGPILFSELFSTDAISVEDLYSARDTGLQLCGSGWPSSRSPC